MARPSLTLHSPAVIILFMQRSLYYAYYYATPFTGRVRRRIG